VTLALSLTDSEIWPR